MRRGYVDLCRRFARSLLALAVLTQVAAVAFAQTVAELSVRATRAAETQPTADDGYLGWQQADPDQPNKFHAYVKPTGGAAFRVNPAGTRGAMGGIDGTTLVYQEFRFSPDLSDLMFFDLATRERSDPPTGVNTLRWEYFPSISGEWLLFGRQKISDGSRAIVLHNTLTGDERILASAEDAWLGPGQVNGNYAVWEKCTRRRCDIFKYEILSELTQQIPNPGNWQYGPAVSEAGTVYFTRHGDPCASRARIFRRSPGSGSELLATIASNRDAGELFARTFPAGATDVYYARFVLTDECRVPRDRFDVYKVIDQGATGIQAASSSESANTLPAQRATSSLYSRSLIPAGGSPTTR